MSRLFSEVARDVLLDFKKKFRGFICTNDLTVEGVHAGIIVFQKCARTSELLCEQMQYASVSGDKPSLGWYVDYATQFEHIQREAEAVRAPDSVWEFEVLNEKIATELMKRLLIALRCHPRSQSIFTCCVRLLTQFNAMHDMFQDEQDVVWTLWDENPKVVDLLECRITRAIKPNFKRMNPSLFFTCSGVDIDSKWCRQFSTVKSAKKKAYTQLDQYVQRLYSTWDALALIEDKTLSHNLLWNEKWLDSRHRQINWFSLNHHVIQLLQLRQMIVKRVWLE